MTSFTQNVADYLQLRRSLGYKLEDHARILRRFAAHLDVVGAEFLTVEMALSWALEPKVSPESVVPATRLLVIRGFALPRPDGFLAPAVTITATMLHLTLERSELVGVAGVRRLPLIGSRAVCGGGRFGGGEGELGVDRRFAGMFGSVGVDAFGVVVGEPGGLDEGAAGFPSDGRVDDGFAASEGAEDVRADLEFADAAGAA
jgi:hypothetical protein